MACFIGLPVTLKNNDDTFNIGVASEIFLFKKGGSLTGIDLRSAARHARTLPLGYRNAITHYSTVPLPITVQYSTTTHYSTVQYHYPLQYSTVPLPITVQYSTTTHYSTVPLNT